MPGVRGANQARQFFEDRGIKWWRATRSGDAKGENGPTRNMASSQIACVNFLLPLANRPDALAAMLAQMDADVTDVCPLEYTAKRTRTDVSSFVDLEWVGLESTLEGERYSRGAYATSADALIVAALRGGSRRAYLIEWKYVEEYRQNGFLGGGSKGEVRTTRYSARYSDPESPFNGSVPLTALLYDPFYQLMRMALLGQKMVEEGEFGVTGARVVVVCPPQNTDYLEVITSRDLEEAFPGVSSVEALLKRVARDPNGIRFTDSPSLVAAVKANGISGLDGWAGYQEERYG